jgi:hypothetical protein
MKRISVLLMSFFFLIQFSFCQEKEDKELKILIHGIVMDATNLSPISNVQILINDMFSSISNTDGTFALYLNKNDTLLFKHLGYKSTLWYRADSLKGEEFVAGVYLHSDTVSIGEVIIVPRFKNIKSEILNSPSKVPATMDNARYNVAVSGYQGRTTTGKLGDPASNYSHIRAQQQTNAYEKGQIPSDQIAGVSPFLLLPAAYLLFHGLPQKPAPFAQPMTKEEIQQIQQLYLDSHK